MTDRVEPIPSRDWIALILAVGLATALNLIVGAILYDAIRDPQGAGISENATQILTGWGGGIIGILGAVFGYKAGAADREGISDERDQRDPDPGPDSTT
jgi:hypothetical protein